MPWGNSILIDCRAKFQKIKPMTETPEMRLYRAKCEVGEALGGTLQEMKESDLVCGLPRHLDNFSVHHVYLRRRLRDTTSILRDVMRKARLPSRKEYMPPLPEVAARVETHLTAPSTSSLRILTKSIVKSDSIESL